MKLSINSSAWQGFAGATELPGGLPPLFGEMTVTRCPAKNLDLACGFTVILDGGTDPDEDIVALTINAMTKECYPVSYRKAWPAADLKKAARFAEDMDDEMSHRHLLAEGFVYEE